MTVTHSTFLHCGNNKYNNYIILYIIHWIQLYWRIEGGPRGALPPPPPLKLVKV